MITKLNNLFSMIRLKLFTKTNGFSNSSIDLSNSDNKSTADNITTSIDTNSNVTLTNSKAPLERRYSARLPLDCNGTLIFSDREIPVTVKDISREGIGFYTEEYFFDVDDNFKFQFIDHHGEIVMGAASLVRLLQEPKRITIGCKQVFCTPHDYFSKSEQTYVAEKLYA